MSTRITLTNAPAAGVTWTPYSEERFYGCDRPDSDPAPVPPYCSWCEAHLDEDDIEAEDQSFNHAFGVEVRYGAISRCCKDTVIGL